MAASAGTAVFIARDGSRSISVDLYLPDAVSTDVTFSPSGLAASTSPNTFRAPFDCYLSEVSLSAAAPTAVGAVVTINGAVVNGGTIKWANQLSTLATRMKYAIQIKAGDMVGLRQY